MSKHLMLSYEWGHQDLVKRIRDGMQQLGIPTWMDIEGGMAGNIYESMAKGVDGAGALVCFMTQKYQESQNCKRELCYAADQGVPIVPVMAQKDYKAKEWLGLVTAGLLWIDFRESDNFDTRLQSLCKEVVHKAENLKIGQASGGSAAVAVKLTTKNPGRAFRHKNTGKFLAESGEVKFHQASGSRSTLVLRDSAEATSYWMEKVSNKENGLFNYQNYASNGFLGYDPNGDYIYTKGQAYGAEQWQLRSDESATDGHRQIVIYADYGKKYLAIVNGKLTGVSNPNSDCLWIVE